MNILHLQTELNITCGVTKTIYLLCRNLDENFHNYIIALGGDAINKFTDTNIPVTTIHIGRNSIIGSLRIFFKIFNYCKKNKIDVIHSHHRYFDLLAYIVSKIHHIKTICSVQSKVTGKKRISYKSDYLIAVSNSIKCHLLNYFNVDKKKIVVINNFVDPSEVKIKHDKNKMKEKLGIPSRSFIISFIGRFSIREKGIDILLKAFKDLYVSYSNIYLLLIGDGDDSVFIYDFIEKNSIPCKVIPPQINIFDYYNLIDVLILPSRIEPFGIVVIEAGLMKKICIGSSVDGIKEIIENNIDGLLFESENIESLVDKIKIIISDRHKFEFLANNLYEKVISRFSSDKIIPQYKNLYNSIK